MNLGTGVLYDWRLGPANSVERSHQRRMLKSLPLEALLVGDIGFGGFDHLWYLQNAKRHFLVRVCSTTQLLAQGLIWESGGVWLWPTTRRDKVPLRLRLIRLKPRGLHEEVCLLTNVLDPQLLTRAEAEHLYELRWGIEISVFRSLKQTLGKVKLLGETPKVVLREAESALLALMVCQAMGAWATQTNSRPGTVRYSLAQVVCVVETYGVKIRQGRKGWDFWQCLRLAVVDSYVRKKRKAARRPVKIKDVHPPKPPKILVMNNRLKNKLCEKLKEGKRHVA